MGILVGPATRVLCFGSTGAALDAAVSRMLSAGTAVVAVLDPGGRPDGHDGAPAFDTAAQAARETGANAAIVLLPPDAAADAMMEAIDAALPLIVCATRGVPARDMVKVINYLEGSADLTGPRHSEGNTLLLGPGSAGVITPGAGMVGLLDVEAFSPGPAAVVACSQYLAESAAELLTRHKIGQSACLVTGSALISATRLADALGMLEADPDTEVIVLIGGIGGSAEVEAAAFIKDAVRKPVIACLPGRSAPPGVNLGADGDFACATPDEVRDKAAALREAGALVVPGLDHLAGAVAGKL